MSGQSSLLLAETIITSIWAFASSRAHIVERRALVVASVTVVADEVLKEYVLMLVLHAFIIICELLPEDRAW